MAECFPVKSRFRCFSGQVCRGVLCNTRWAVNPVLYRNLPFIWFNLTYLMSGEIGKANSCIQCCGEAAYCCDCSVELLLLLLQWQRSRSDRLWLCGGSDCQSCGLIVSRHLHCLRISTLTGHTRWVLGSGHYLMSTTIVWPYEVSTGVR